MWQLSQDLLRYAFFRKIFTHDYEMIHKSFRFIYRAYLAQKSKLY